VDEKSDRRDPLGETLASSREGLGGSIKKKKGGIEREKKRKGDGTTVLPGSREKDADSLCKRALAN